MSLLPVVLIQYRLVTDGHIHDGSIYHASTASRGKYVLKPIPHFVGGSSLPFDRPTK